MVPNFDSMNETDVRETIVRPLLHRLGYLQGTSANIRTEVTLRYDKAFLGRKNSKKDPKLAGRADYICDAVSFGSWTIEVKSPSFDLSQDDVEQAHTYSAHPEICAVYFLLTNGREFRLYATGQLSSPQLRWQYGDTETVLMVLFNIVGYEAIKKLAKLIRPDVGKPLGKGLPSKLKIVGGEVLYGEHKSNHPLLRIDALNGLKGPVNGVAVNRTEEGQISAIVSIIGPHQQLNELNKLVGVENFEFLSSDEYVSVDQNKPTIFQNLIKGRLEPGAKYRAMPGLAEIALPFGFDFSVETVATGFMEGSNFVGVIAFAYDYAFIKGNPTGIAQIDNLIQNSPRIGRLEGEGQFKIITG